MASNGPTAKDCQCDCHDTVPWLISISLDSARAAVAKKPKSPLDCILGVAYRSAIMDSVLARVAQCWNCRYRRRASVHRPLSSPFLLCVARRVHHEHLVRHLSSVG